jgi:phage protein D
VSNDGMPQGPQVKVDGSPLSDRMMAALIDIRVEQSLWVASRFTLRFIDKDFEIIDGSTFAIGKEVKIGFSNGTAVTHVMTGEIGSLASEQATYGLHEFVVSGYDLSHRLGNETKIRSFTNQKYSDIASRIAGEHGLQAEVTATTITFPYLMQTTTDHEFLTEIAFRAGYDWWVEDAKLLFKPRADPAKVADLELGVTLGRFKARFSVAEQATGTKVTSWDGVNQTVIESKSSTRAGDGKLADTGSKASLLTGRTASKANAGVATLSTVLAETTAEANELAESYGRLLAGAELVAKGEVWGRPDLRAGKVVHIKGVGSKLTGDYLLASVEHLVTRASGLTTRFTTGGAESRSIVDLLGGRDGRADRFGRTGVVVGVVTNNQDPDNLGRVKVSFKGLSKADDSNWARLVLPGAGKARGAMFLPQIDDEVVVAFEQGDLRRPYVIGGLWSAKAAPPSTKVAEGKNVTDWLIQSKNGHVMLLRDGDGADKKHFSVVLDDKKSTLFLGEDKIQIISNGKTIEMKDGKSSIVMDGKGGITITGKNVTIEAQQDLVLKGSVGALEAQNSLKLKGAMVTVKADGKISVEAGGPAALKGAVVQIN